MSPTIADGEYLIVAPIDAARVAVGDIVFCQMRRGPIAHRVCAIDARPGNGRHFMLYGDASLDGDLPVAARQLRGQVVGVERGGQRLGLKIFGGPVGRAAFMFALQLRRSIRVARARLGAALIPATLPR
ncbi:MAG TPA: S24/S26 family peptidase [Polyangia bacterium]